MVNFLNLPLIVLFILIIMDAHSRTRVHNMHFFELNENKMNRIQKTIVVDGQLTAKFAATLFSRVARNSKHYDAPTIVDGCFYCPDIKTGEFFKVHAAVLDTFNPEDDADFHFISKKVAGTVYWLKISTTPEFVSSTLKTLHSDLSPLKMTHQTPAIIRNLFLDGMAASTRYEHGSYERRALLEALSTYAASHDLEMSPITIIDAIK